MIKKDKEGETKLKRAVLKFGLRCVRTRDSDFTLKRKRTIITLTIAKSLEQ